VIDAPAPDPTSFSPRDLFQLLRLGKHFADADDEGLAVRMKLMTMAAADLLDEWFESDVLKAPMSVSGIIGTNLGVRSPGTAYVMLHHYMGEIDGAYRSWGFARGGTGAVSNAIAASARHFGAEIRTEAAVERVIVSGGEASGVVLRNGDEIRARQVVSCCDPRLTFLGLVGREHLPTEFARDIDRFRFRGSSGKVNLALDRLPSFPGRAPGDFEHLRGDVAIAPGVDYLEVAFDESKAGAFSRRPYVNVVFPSTVDPSVAPPGKHVMSCFVQYAPYHLAAGTWDEQREAFGDTVIDTLAEYAPNIRDIILHRQVVTPLDLEREWGLSEGNIFQGELTLEQLFFLRPAPGWAQYRTPVGNLYMCGSATHPGGGIMGAPGRNAAKKILGDSRA
jgi:phytoene dehydrogenase-like protein